ncbi:MAG: DUF4743 domain-containing protein [Alphaproteobacteria bacterium]|nr:DUF4743 domain-containing protein [Alphaproteobacteria bacterium]
MTLLRHIHVVNAWNPARFLPLLLGERRVGRIRRDLAPALGAFPAVFAVADDAVRIVPADAGPDALTAAVGLAVRRLVQDGCIASWRGEWFDVGAEDDPRPLFRIDRGALACLGVRAYGVHLNGYVRRPDGLHLWIGRRAPNKAVDPDKLDNMVAGGISAGHDPWSTLLKEAEEEASLPQAVAGRAVPVGIVSYVMEREGGLRDDVLYLYDLEMPGDRVPRPNDDEITGFTLMPAAEVLARVRDGDDFKFNVNVTLIDFFVRHGILAPGDPDYLAICRGLRR